MGKFNRTYLTYYNDKIGCETTIVCRSQESLDKHIELHKLDINKICISDKPPRSPEVTEQSINRILSSARQSSLWSNRTSKRNWHESII